MSQSAIATHTRARPMLESGLYDPPMNGLHLAEYDAYADDNRTVKRWDIDPARVTMAWGRVETALRGPGGQVLPLPTERPDCLVLELRMDGAVITEIAVTQGQRAQVATILRRFTIEQGGTRCIF